MFKFLGLQPGEYWQILLFKDIQNYSGITESNPDKLFTELNIAKHLPESVRSKFKYTIMELCYKVLKFNRKLLQEGNINDAVATQVPTDSQENVSSEPDHEFICK